MRQPFDVHLFATIRPSSSTLTLLASASRLLEDLDAEHAETTVEVDNPVEWTYDGDKTFTDYEVRVTAGVWALKGPESKVLAFLARANMIDRLPPVTSISTILSTFRLSLLPTSPSSPTLAPLFAARMTNSNGCSSSWKRQQSLRFPPPCRRRRTESKPCLTF